MKKKLVDLFLEKSEMTATATINGESHELSMPIGGSKLEDPVKPWKKQMYYYFCHVIDYEDPVVSGKRYALTVVSKLDQKCYLENLKYKENETIDIISDLTSVGLDGNGKIICGWHNRLKAVDEKKISDNYFDIGFRNRIYFKRKNKKKETYNAKKQNLNDILTSNVLVCEKNVNIDLDEKFVDYIAKIGRFTRENDVTYPYARMSEEIAKFDNIRTGIGAVSMFVPIGRAYKFTQEVISMIMDLIGSSSLVLPATDFYNLRGPVKLTPVTMDTYAAYLGQDGEYHYKDKPDETIGNKEDYELKLE